MALPTDRENERGEDWQSRPHHVLLLHLGNSDSLDGLRTMFRRATEAAEVLCVVTPETHVLIEETIGAVADFEDVTELGRNPARVIPAIRQFVDTRGRGRHVVVVTEQWWKRREMAEAAEIARHEALANLAFEGNDVDLVCLYDTRSVAAEIVADAKRTHPLIADEGGVRPNPWYVDPHEMLERSSAPLEPPPRAAETFEVESGHLSELRASVEERGYTAGLPLGRVEDLVLAANEVATNVVSHGSGHGLLRLWTEGAWLVCEITDKGSDEDALAEDPFIGTRSPPVEDTTGRGLWMVNQLCDLVELRSGHSGTAVRLRFGRPGSAWSASPVCC